MFKVFQSFSESGRLAKDFIFKTEKCILVSTNSACGSPLTRHSWHAYFSAAGRVNINIHYNLRLELSLSGLHIPLRLKYLPLFRETISQPLQYTIADCNWRLVASWCSVDRYYDDCDSWHLMIKRSQELRMLSRSLIECQSLTLNFMIQVSQFVNNSQLCHSIALNVSVFVFLFVFVFVLVMPCLLIPLINCQKGHICLRQL